VLVPSSVSGQGPYWSRNAALQVPAVLRPKRSIRPAICQGRLRRRWTA